MEGIYNLLTGLSGSVIKVAGNFSPKLKDFSQGRKDLFARLEEAVDPQDKYFWIHAASLGEFEMAVPILDLLKKKYPEHKTVVSFFSPSGFNNKKSHPLVDIFTYLPLDTRKNARRFIELLNPQLVFFIKYDFWPNFLNELKTRNIRTFLISGIFREDQTFFKFYGKWMRKSLSAFEHFFLQDKNSIELLSSIGLENTTLAGDTRFDRVAAQITLDNKLDFMAEFKDNQILTVFGSTWPEDENLILKFINGSSSVKFVIAPHEIKPEKIKHLEKAIRIPVIKYSEREGKDLSQYRVFIMDTIGHLGRAYSYADIAYVGGAAGTTGLHNILEPATFETPIVIGKNFEKFPEAEKLRKLGGLFSVKNSVEFSAIMTKLHTNKEFREEAGMIAGRFISSNTGTTAILNSYLDSHPIKF